MNGSRRERLISYRAAFAGTVCVAALLALTGCRGDSKEPSTASSAGGPVVKPRIALIMKSLANEFFATMAEGARNGTKKSIQPHSTWL